MVQLISYLITHYFGIKCEEFTAKIIAAFALLNTVPDVPEEDLKQVKWIEQNTHKDVMVSVYELDRDINPSKGEFKQILRKNKYKRNDWNTRSDRGYDEYVILSPGRQQFYLCLAVKEINNIVCRNIKGYCDEVKIPGMGDGMGGNSSGNGIVDIEVP